MNNNHLNNNLNVNSQSWMMGTEPNNNYNMVSRTNMLPIPQPSTTPSQESHVSALAQETNSNKKRSVIPSKRAAQNRAAQKAFRQRREQYIKDLEIKAKEMDEWQMVMDNLRNENKELRDRIQLLENKINLLTGGDPNKLKELKEKEKMFISNDDDNNNNNSEHITDDDEDEEDEDEIDEEEEEENEEEEEEGEEETNDNEIKRLKNMQERSMSLPISIVKNEPPYIPIPLRAPTQTPAPIYQTKRKSSNHSSSSMSNINEPIGIQHMQPMPYNPNHPPNVYWDNNNAAPIPEFDLEFDFDPFFEDEFGPTITNSNDFLPNENSNQVLDDLFAMLQTRQRPQIPMIPTSEEGNNSSQQLNLLSENNNDDNNNNIGRL